MTWLVEMTSGQQAYDIGIFIGLVICWVAIPIGLMLHNQEKL